MRQVGSWASAAVLALAVTTLLVGCSSQAGSPVSPSLTPAASVSAGSTDANGSTYVLTYFDGTSLVMGLNAQGRAINATYGSTTAFKLAVLSKYAPTDPCRTAASDFNNWLSSGVGINDTVFATSVNELVTSSCQAKVLLSGTTIKTFQPGS